MTILQLKYVITIASSSSFREAAGKLYISQPALSITVKELEDELNIHIFERTNKGIRLTKEGEEFLAYAKEAVSHYKLIEDRYIEDTKNKSHFSVSMQHYVFAIHAFVNVIKDVDVSKYVYSVNETRTYEVIENVRNYKSEVGIISYTKSNEKVIKKLFREYQLKFYPLMTRDTYVYVSKSHPLSGREMLSIEELKDYPCVSFDQSSESDYYLSEEALSDYDFVKLIKTNDRATSAELMYVLNGYSIGTGIMTESMALKDDFVCIKLKEEDTLTIGYIVNNNHVFSDLGEKYIKELEKYKEE